MNADAEVMESQSAKGGSRLAPGAATLAAAVEAVSAVAHSGRSADFALQAADERGDRAAVRAIALGTLRWYLRLAPALSSIVDRPAEDIPPLLRSLLVTAAHQIEYSRSAPEVSVHLAVDAARALGLGRATGFVNAVLRRFVRERDDLLERADRDLATRVAHPKWFVDRLESVYRDRANSILAANNEHPPMTLRVAPSTAVADYLAELAAAGREAFALETPPGAVVLTQSIPVAGLPGFAEGRVSVQDAGTQFAAWLLDVQSGHRVLDACAAPGGKSAHILQRQPKIELLAVDDDAARLALVSSTFERIGASPSRARTRLADLADPEALSDELHFDRILVDAPCSATGVIRRHPDIKLLRRTEDGARFAALQKRILGHCFSKLTPGGKLVYATCSVLPEENEAVVKAFLAATPEAKVVPWPEDIVLPPGALRREVGVQLIPAPGQASTDGFYYACLVRDRGA
jgi:16S rRNA (cytosine967-C5)-methyltransferase